MSTPATPTKRILTEDAHNASNVPRTPPSSIISEDLSARLQNLGSRVRKSVNEGYATQRFGVVTSSAPTPFSSPVKSSTTTTLSQASPIFRSANDTLLDVFSSPVHASAANAPSPSPSRRKRGRVEADSQEEGKECLSGGTGDSRDDDLTMTGLEVQAGDEDITIITNAGPKQSPKRPVRPLKKVARVYRPPIPSYNSSSDAPQPCSGSAEAVSRTDEATPVSMEWQSLVN